MSTHTDATSVSASTPPAAAQPLRALGSSGLTVSELCLGGNVFGWTIDERTSHDVLDAFVAGGGTFIDTADIYSSWVPGNSGGESETIIGSWLAQDRSRREAVVIATKLGSPMPSGQGLGAAHIRRAAEDSLRRLGIETIDLLYAHRPDDSTPIEETLTAFQQLITEGKVRAIGASNYSAAQLREALEVADREGLTRYTALQPEYNLVSRESFEGALQDLCVREGIAVAPYYGLASGFLTGKYRKGGAAVDSKRAAGVLSQFGTEAGWAALDAVLAVAARHGATPAQIALAWLAAQDGVVSPIASATSVDQLTDILGAAAIELTAEDLTELH